jgi:SAM-dependent methyltransferase
MVRLLGQAIETRLASFAAPLAHGGRCLDVGCGAQPLRIRIAAMGFEYVSFDVHQNAAGNVDVLGAIDADLPEDLRRRGPFDFILCTEVLEHVSGWPEAFANLTALLKPGGRLLVTCPHIWMPHEEPTDFYRPTTWALAFHAERCGLRTLELTRAGDGYDVLGTVLRSTRMRPAIGLWWLWPLVWPLQLLRRLALVLLAQRWMHHVIELRTALYLSAIGVFEKS